MKQSSINIPLTKTEKTVEEMIKSMVDSNLYEKWKKKQKEQHESFLKQNKSLSGGNEIQNLDIQDLLSHQKKNLSKFRWMKMKEINESLQMQQQSFKHFFSIASQSNYRRLQHPGYYKLILEERVKYPLMFFSSIEKDVNRTLSNNHQFQTPLRNVLEAYAIRNPSLLYCQGMNYIVAFLLINQVTEEQTFWILTCLIENILPDDYFKDLTTIHITSTIFTDLLGEIFPEFKHEMDEIGMESSLFLVGWFVCLFTKGFINSVSAYILNTIMLQSINYKMDFVLLKMALGIIATILTRDQPFTYQTDFKSFKDNLELRVFQISLPEIQNGITLIQLNYANFLQLNHYYRTKKSHQRSLLNNNIKFQQKKLPLPVCSLNYPVCLHRIQIEKKIGSVEQALILKNGYSIKSQYFQNYLEKDQKKDESKQLKEISYLDIKDCPITRQTHICNLNEQVAQQNLKKKTQFKRQSMAIELLNQCDTSIEFQINSSKLENKFVELSSYFIVDQNFNTEEADQIQDQLEEEWRKQFDHYRVQKQHQETKASSNDKNLTSFFSKIINKVLKKVNFLRESNQKQNGKDKN